MAGFDFDSEYASGRSSWQRLPPAVQAALVFALPFIVADFFNYYSAGTALIISFPILVLFYTGCGALTCHFAAAAGQTHSNAYLGATGGLLLWLASTVVNTVIGLVVGTVSLGATLLLGLPYLCLCAPVQLIGGGLFGAFGGLLYGWVIGKRPASGDDFESW